MIHFDPSILVEFGFGLFLWWVSVYLITQNPFSRTVQLASGILATISIYFSTDIFFSAIATTHQFSLDITLLKLISFALYLPMAFLYHASLFITKTKRTVWQNVALYANYLFAIILILIEASTNLMRDYPKFLDSNFSGNLADATGPYFFLMGIFIFTSLILTAINFYKAMVDEKKYSENWYKFFWPFAGLVLSTLMGPFVLLSYYGLIPHPIILPVIDLALIIFPLTYSILKYSLFIDEAKVIFGKNFLYSTLVTLVILIIYFTIIFLTDTPFDSINSLILPFIFSYLLIASHSVYGWFVTFVRDIIYNVPSGYSVVNDEEVARAIKDFNNPKKLEENPLLRLDLVEKIIKCGEANTPVDALKKVMRDAVEYFRPDEEINRRLKQNLKYHLLKMLTVEQAEEGQILWELGFEEYPVRIMSQENNTREPIFKIKSPSDYSYISRNAFMALKKEAIHDVSWRISYLEKSIKRKYRVLEKRTA